MSLEITTVRSHQDLFDFLNLPKAIYHCLKYCPEPATPAMLNPFSLPPGRFLYQYFLAFENGRPVGRVAAIIDLQYREPDTGFFGAFETIEQPVVARELLNRAENWLRAHRRKRMVGPATLNTNQQVGLLIEGFEEPPAPFIPYNPPYYQRLIEECNFSKLIDLLSFAGSLKQAIPSPLSKIAGRAAQKKGLAMRAVNPFQLRQDVFLITCILNEAMADNWGYIPLTPGEILNLLNYCFAKGDPSLALIIMIEKKPAAFSLSLPADKENHENHRARLALLAVVPKFRTLGLESLLVTTTVQVLQERNYSTLEMSQVDENNSAMIKIIKKFPCRLIKRHRVYQKNIE